MILLGGILVASFMAWQIRVYGTYLALCDALGLVVGAGATVAFGASVGDVIPWTHPLKGTASAAGTFVVVWMMFRSVTRSFAGGQNVDFGRSLDTVGGGAFAFVGIMVFIGTTSLIALTSGRQLPQQQMLAEPLRQAASIGLGAARFVAWFVGSTQDLTLDVVLKHLTT